MVQLSDTSQRIKIVLGLPVNMVDIVKNRADVKNMEFPVFVPDQLSLFFPSVYAKVSTSVPCCVLSTVLIGTDWDCLQAGCIYVFRPVGGIFTLWVR
jgi:hypothetical protein